MELSVELVQIRMKFEKRHTNQGSFLSQPAGTSYCYVDTDADLEPLVARMKQADRIAMDTEADSLHHYFEKVCLIQLTIDHENYIVDPLSGMDLSGFLDVLADKRLILHGADYDLRQMRSSFAFVPRGEVFDTMLAAQLLGYEQLGLGALARQLAGVTLTTRSQKSNWAHRPLTETQLRYACDDTRYLSMIADRLASELSKLGRMEWHRESCASMIRATASTNHREPELAWRIKGIRLMNRRQLAFVRQIWRWREKEAQRVDRPPFKILQNQCIIALAYWASANPDIDLADGPKLPRGCRGERLGRLHRAIETARHMREARWPDHLKPQGTMPNCQPRINALRDECARIAAGLGITPSILAPKAALIAIARKRPRTLEQIMEAGPLMRWQAKLLEDGIARSMDSL